LSCADGHFEVPRRLEEVIRGINEIKEAFPESNLTLEIGTFEKATIEDCLQAHDAEYITAQSGKAPSCAALISAFLVNLFDLFLSDPKSIPLHATQRIADDSSEPMDTFMSFSSWDAALLAAGSVIHAVDLVTDISNVRR
jgi:acetoin utilization deacetylase AcuC-like enzyme